MAILTTRIRYLTAHLQKHKKDKNTLRALQHILNRRRKALREVAKGSQEEYRDLIDRLELRDMLKGERESTNKYDNLDGGRK